jgi:polyhydroxybutyrate depolymerase
MRTASCALHRVLTMSLLAFLASTAHAGVVTERIGGREVLLYVPAHLPPAGQRALVVVLHGGLGNAQRIESKRSEVALNMDAVAEADGFLVAYLNGSRVARLLGDDKEGWNAGGGCCGLSAANNVDDVAYIEGAVARLATEYGIDPLRVYGMGHSNGAMMTQRMLCETTLFAAGVAISGPLNLPVSYCPQARGRRVLAIHGRDDRNVPVNGGRGALSVSRVAYRSEQDSRQVFTQSGGSYDLQVIDGVPHWLDRIDAAVQSNEGLSIPQKAARFFGLER